MLGAPVVTLSDGMSLLTHAPALPARRKMGPVRFRRPRATRMQDLSLLAAPHVAPHDPRPLQLEIGNHSADVIRLLFPHQAGRCYRRKGKKGRSGNSRTSLVAHGWPVYAAGPRHLQLDGFDELTARIDCLRMLQKLADPASPIPKCPAASGCR